MEGFGLMPGSKNLDNQMLVLTSRSLVNKTLDELNYDIGYFRRSNFGMLPVYPERPLEVTFSGDRSIVENIAFKFRYKGDNRFIVDAESKGVFELHGEALFGDTLRLPGCNLVIHAADKQWLNYKMNRKVYFILHSRRELASDYLKRLSIEQGSRKGSIIKISIKGKNKEKDLAFLEKFTGIFVNISLDKKNSEANRTIKFIDEQLVGISDSLVITENKLQRFRSQNRIMNLSAQGQAIIDQAMNLEIEKGKLELESNYYSYLS
ncbi:MAG: hypothetical protein MUD02_01530, partial [Bacteroidales bacterium]|nr:hypothetical protein [Bacteroidales bacterium]